MKLINPPKIKKGDTIGVVAPSSGLAKLFLHRIENGKKALEEMGFKVVFANHALEMNNYVSASAKERADDINQMFRNKNVKAIICTIGGNHSNQILKYLDFGLIKSYPKIFLGYSDITILHYALAKKANLRTFYGPCLMTEFGEYPKILSYTLKYFQKASMNFEPIGKVEASKEWTDEFLDWFHKKDLERPRRLLRNEGYEWWKEGKVEGEIFGGTIPSINHLAGSEYWVDLTDKVFFIDIPEGETPGGPYSQAQLDSFFADLDNLKVFTQIKGLIIGRPYSYKKEDVEKLKDIIGQYTEDANYPILYNANIGHASPMITLPMGVKVRLDSITDRFEILESGVV